MKILLVGNYPPPFGGISVHVQLLNRMLLREGIDTRVLNIDPRAKSSRDYIKIRGYIGFIHQLVFMSCGRIVHLHTNGHNTMSWLIALCCAWAGRILGRGSIFTIHSGMAPEYINGGGPLRRLLIRLALAPQSLVVCVNEQIRGALEGLGYKKSKTLLMPAFLFDPAEVAQLDENRERELSRFRPLLSLVAFFRQEYGVELLIEALAEMRKNFPNVGCAIMGSGDGEKSLRQLAEERGVADRLLWLGDLRHGECLGVIKRSDIFVRPTFADGDSVSVREAVELGIPVVASNVGHRPPEVLLFEPGNVVDLTSKCNNALLGVAPSLQKKREGAKGFLALISAYKQIDGERVEERTTKTQRHKEIIKNLCLFVSLWLLYQL
jgi:glycogen synthase